MGTLTHQAYRTNGHVRPNQQIGQSGMRARYMGMLTLPPSRTNNACLIRGHACSAIGHTQPHHARPIQLWYLLGNAPYNFGCNNNELGLLLQVLTYPPKFPPFFFYFLFLGHIAPHLYYCTESFQLATYQCCRVLMVWPESRTWRRARWLLWMWMLLPLPSWPLDTRSMPAALS